MFSTIKLFIWLFIQWNQEDRNCIRDDTRWFNEAQLLKLRLCETFAQISSKLRLLFLSEIGDTCNWSTLLLIIQHMSLKTYKQTNKHEMTLEYYCTCRYRSFLSQATFTTILKVFWYSFSEAILIFSISLKVVLPCPIAIKFSPVIGHGLKFVKM